MHTAAPHADPAGANRAPINWPPTLVMAGGLACAAVALVLFAWLGGEVKEGEMRPFDLRAHSVIYQPNYLPHLTTVMEQITTLGSGEFLVPLALGLVLAFLIAGSTRHALLFFATLSGAGLLEWLLKRCFRIPRPTMWHLITLPTSYSFPSGHALASFCFYGLLAGVITGLMRNRAAKVFIWIIAALLVVLIGISRIYLGVHNASDVLAGYAAALLWVTAVLAADHLWRLGAPYALPRSGTRTGE